MKIATSSFLLLAAALVAVPLRAVPEAEAVAGRSIVAKNADAIVSVELVVTANVGRGRGPQERKIEVNGTVIKPSGLTVTSLASIDPRVTNQGRGGGDSSDTEFKEVKLRLADNTEIPAAVVLKDADLDLAFIAPVVDPGATLPPFAYVDLTNTAEPEVLGTYYDMTRLGKNMQRAPVIQTVTVIGVVERPRKLILTSDETLGCPVFAEDGRPLGISLVYLSNGTAIRIVVVPGADIMDIAQQAEAVDPASVLIPSASDSGSDSTGDTSGSE